MFRKLVFKVMDWVTGLEEQYRDVDPSELPMVILKRFAKWFPLLLAIGLLFLSFYLWIILSAYAAWGFIATVGVMWILNAISLFMQKILPRIVVKRAEPYMDEWLDMETDKKMKSRNLRDYTKAR